MNKDHFGLCAYINSYDSKDYVTFCNKILAHIYNKDIDHIVITPFLKILS